MRLGIVGAGNVGGNLAKIWARIGHTIMLGVRDPKGPSVRALLDSIGLNVRVGSVKDAAAFGEVVVLATPWPATKDAIQLAGNLKGKVLVDCTNPLATDLSGLSIGYTTSAAEQIARWATGARVVKAFNTIGAKNFLNPKFDSQKASMFICGDDQAAKSLVTTLAEECGFEAIDAGPLSKARLLEPLAMLWIHLALVQGMGPDIAFKLLRR